MGHPSEEWLTAFFERHRENLQYWSLAALAARVREETIAEMLQGNREIAKRKAAELLEELKNTQEKH